MIQNIHHEFHIGRRYWYEPRQICRKMGQDGLVYELWRIPGGPRADPKIENRRESASNHPLDSGLLGGLFFENNARELDFKDLQS